MIFRSPTAFSQSALRGLVGMVCMGVGMVMLSGNTCLASCGDYVVLRGSHAKMDKAKRPLNIPVPNKVPCNSPACRGDVPLSPVPTAPSSESPTEKPLAILAATLDLTAGNPGCEGYFTQEQVRPGFRSPLERPPSL